MLSGMYGGVFAYDLEVANALDVSVDGSEGAARLGDVPEQEA